MALTMLCWNLQVMDSCYNATPPGWNTRGRRSHRTISNEHGGMVGNGGVQLKTGTFSNAHLFNELGELVLSFTHHQKELIRRVGFGVFVDVPIRVRLDKQFCTWLLLNVDTEFQQFKFGCGGRSKIAGDDVARVFGLPCIGMMVWDASLDKSEKMRQRLRDKLGMGDTTATPSVAARMQLESLGPDLRADEEECFVISFVIYVVSMLVDSKGTQDAECDNYWPPLKVTDRIGDFNRSEMVLADAMNACVSMKLAVKKCAVYSPLAGCMLFLVVTYSSCSLGNGSCFQFRFPIFCLLVRYGTLKMRHGMGSQIEAKLFHM